MGSLLMRGANDEVGRVMGEFYWKHGFNSKLHSILRDAGFSEAAANSVRGSEWGMQDEGRASYDAYGIADEVRESVKVSA